MMTASLSFRNALGLVSNAPAILLAAGLAILPAVAQELRNPEQMGPYPVGVTSIQFDDASRPDPDLGPRPLRTEIWYPAIDASRGMPKNLYSEFILRASVPERWTPPTKA
jgi:hypothetical protein